MGNVVMPRSFGNLRFVRLKYQEVCAQYRHLKVWREGLEVAIKIKGSLSSATGGVGEARASVYSNKSEQCGSCQP